MALYTAEVQADSGRNGRVRSSDGLLDLELALPKSLGGTGARTNPEQLFAAGYSACFASSIEFLAHRDSVAVTSTRVDAAVTLNQTEAGPFALGVTLSVTLGGVALPEAEALVEKAHQVCPYSNAVRGNIDVALHTAVI